MELHYCDVKICPKHNRKFEAICITCECPICASCAMFDIHLKHDILPYSEGVKYLRGEINESIYSQLNNNKKVDLLIYKNKLNNSKFELIKKIQDSFNSLITVIRERKAKIIDILLYKYKIEENKLNNQIILWENNKNIVEKILDYALKDSDKDILIHSKFIIDNLKKLNKDIQNYKKINIYNIIDDKLVLNNIKNNLNKPIKINYEEIIQYLKEYIKILEPNKIPINYELNINTNIKINK